jgi:hypothetical protein
MTRRHGRRQIEVALTAVLLLVGGRGRTWAETPTPDGGSGATLKSEFFQPFAKTGSANGAPGRSVGRLTIRLDTEGGSRIVPVSYPFHSGDHLRFEVSANRDGWLYVLHRGPDGKVEHLWPPAETTATSTVNRVHERATVIVPAEGTFEFDNDTGNEHFYFVIRSERGWPDQEAATPAVLPIPKTRGAGGERKRKRPSATSTQAIADSGSPTLLNFRVRGLKYVPPSSDNDQSLYFAVSAPSQTGEAILEFQLMHHP